MVRSRVQRGAVGVVGGAAFLLASLQGSTAWGGAARVVDTPSALILENDEARFTFSKAFRGSLVGLEDRESGTDFLAGLPYPSALFQLVTAAAGCADGEIHNLSGGAFIPAGERLADGARAMLRYTAVGGYDLDVTVTVTLPDASPRALWRISVENRDAAVTLRGVSFPILLLRAAVGDAASDDALAFPALDGVLLREPAALSSGEGLLATYPGDASVQMAALYDSNAGLYLATHDASGSTKRFAYVRVEPEGTPAALLMVTYGVPEVAGSGVVLDAPAALGPFRGDWYDAAQLYRGWALGQRWVPAPLVARHDVPAWWRRGLPVITSPAYGDDGAAHLPASLMPARALEYAASLGRPVTLLTFGWEHYGAWTSPNFFPPRDGEPGWRSATTALAGDGSHAYVYLSGTVWRLGRAQLPGYDDTTHFEQVGRPYAAETCQGGALFDDFYGSIGWPSVRMCPGTAFWRDTVVSAVTTAAGLGIDTVSVDEFPIGAVYPCYASSHGHPPGSGSWQGAAYRTMLAAARREGRLVNPRLALTCEEPNELYLDLLDGYVSRENTPDGFLYAAMLRQWGDRFSAIPLFSAVYHEYSASVAEAPPVYDASGHLEALRTSYARGLAAAFVLGKVPAAAVAPLASADPQLLDLFRRVAAATGSYARPYALFGRMLRPPSLAVPRVTFSWADVDLVSGGIILRDTGAPAVLAGAWESPEGGRAVLLANITASGVQVSVPAAFDALAVPVSLTRVVDGTSETVYTGNDPPHEVEVALPAWGIAMVEVRSLPPDPPRARRHLTE